MKGKMRKEGIIILILSIIVLLVFILIKGTGRNLAGDAESLGSDPTGSEDADSGEEEFGSMDVFSSAPLDSEDGESGSGDVSGSASSASGTSPSNDAEPDSIVPDSTVSGTDIKMDAEAKEMFRSVLLGDTPFFYVAEAKPENVNLVPYFAPYAADREAEAMNIADIPSIFYGGGECTRIWNFFVVDLDRDGEEEVILYVLGVAGDAGGKIILHRMGNDIYGYRTGWRTMYEVKEDGTYDYADASGLLEMGIVIVTEFSETGYTVEKLFYKTGDGRGVWEAFYVNDQPVTEKEYSELEKAQDEKPRVEWYEFTEENINAILQ